MKELMTTLCALLFSTSLNAADIVPLEIEFGMWKNELAEKITASLNLKEGPMAKAMAQMEEAAKKNPQMAKQYEKYMKMMKAQQKNLSAASSASCLNEKTLKEGIDKIVNQKKDDKCVNKIEKSTGTFLKGKTTCEGKTHSYEMKVTNPKTIEVKLQMDNDKGPKKLNFKMFWVSSECAKG